MKGGRGECAPLGTNEKRVHRFIRPQSSGGAGEEMAPEPSRAPGSGGPVPAGPASCPRVWLPGVGAGARPN